MYVGGVLNVGYYFGQIRSLMIICKELKHSMLSGNADIPVHSMNNVSVELYERSHVSVYVNVNII